MTDRGIALTGLPIEIDNVYLREALLVDPRVEQRGYIDSFWSSCEGMSCWKERNELTKRYAWGIPNDTAIRAIASRGPVVEIGAGTGYWASLLRQAKCDVVAYDEKPGENGWVQVEQCYYDVQVGQHEVVTAHQDRTLLLCWPPMSDMAELALRAYRGQTVVYVGENAGGCCASDEFFALLEDWSEACEVRIPQWWGLHDAMWIYERKL